MGDDDYGAGFFLLALVAGSLALAILAFLSRLRTRVPSSTSEAATFGTALFAAIAGFFVVVLWPIVFAFPAALAILGAVGVWKRNALAARDRATLLGLSAILWLGLVPYGLRMQRWEQTVSGAIRVDALFTALLGAAWAFIGMWAIGDPVVRTPRAGRASP